MKLYTDYPAIPEPTIAPTTGGRGLPDAPGVYFVWEGDAVVYVGQSRSLQRRARRGHYNIGAHRMLSFVEIPEADLLWAESYYIGVLRPERNYIGTRNRPPLKPRTKKDPAYFQRFLKAYASAGGA